MASAVNNAISRVGPQLAGALIFVAIATSFYNQVGERVGLPGSSVELRTLVAPLNPPEEGASPELRGAAEAESTDAFHLAMLISAGLLVIGAGVNAVGIRNPPRPAPIPEPELAEAPSAHALFGHPGHLCGPTEAADHPT